MLLIVVFGLLNVGRSSSSSINGNLDNANTKEALEQKVKQYLWTFGYIDGSSDERVRERNIVEITKYGVQTALQRFQKSFLIYGSEVIDVPTQAKLFEYRCGNRDMNHGTDLQALPRSEIWQKKVLLWNITSYPISLTEGQVRDACNEAFERWRKATDFRFIEIGDSVRADIVISFKDIPNSNLNVIARASNPQRSQIVLDKNHLWSFRNHLLRGNSLFHTLLHEIGHTLGLQHTFYRGSIMYPILKSSLSSYENLDVPRIDKLAIRRLYGRSLPLNSDSGTPIDLIESTKCPRYIDSVTTVSNSEWLIFRGNKVWRTNNRKIVSGGRNIQDVFVKGPEFVNATVTSNNLVLLFVERTIYGYEFDGVTFNEAQDFPRELHERVLFYPQGAFPLNNGSVILISGGVFATYNVLENAPSFLNDKNRYFPNLPEDFKAGVPKDIHSDDSYWMFDESTVSDYDMTTKQVLQLQTISDFFKCD